MEKRKAVRRKADSTAEAKRGVASDAESTVSTRSSNSSNDSGAVSSLKWKREQRRLKASRPRTEEQDQVQEEDDGVQSKSLEDTLGAILETTEAQMVTIVLIALDICCTAVEIHLQDQKQLAMITQQLGDKQGVGVSLVTRIVARLVESFTGFTIFLFIIELAVLLAAFGRKFFSHAGYLLDLVVVSVSLTVELYAQTKAARLLGILRIWRVLRLVGGLIDRERSAHDATRLLLEKEQVRFLHVQMQKDAARESLKREYESREGLERLLRGYKDEIVTLKEALQIAAQAVAEATMSEETTTPVNPEMHAFTEGVTPVDADMYAYSEDAVAGASYDSIPVSYDDFTEEYEQEAAVVYPTGLHTEVDTKKWQ